MSETAERGLRGRATRTHAVTEVPSSSPEEMEVPSIRLSVCAVESSRVASQTRSSSSDSESLPPTLNMEDEASGRWTFIMCDALRFATASKS